MNRTRRFRHVVFLVALSLALAAAPCVAKVYIDIDSPGFRRLPMALFSLDGSPPGTACEQEDLPGAIAGVLLQDLEVSGYFRMLSPEAFLPAASDVRLYPAEIDFHAWRLIGAEALILFQTRCEGVEVSCEAQLLDVLTGKLLTWKRYKSRVDGYRQVAHRFANEVERELTGTPGAFDTRIAYISNATGAKELYVMDYDGHGSKQLTQLGSISLSPAWSPDGSRIAFTSFWKENPGLHVLELKQPSHLERLLQGFSPLSSGASWSADGAWLAFSASLDGNTDIFRMRVGKDAKPERLTSSWSIDVSPSWSPDGKEVAFVSDRAGHPDLYILRVEDRRVRRLTFEGSYNADPDWSPAGDRIVFVSRVDETFQIVSLRPDGTDRRQITDGAGDHVAPAWSPNGRLIVFSSDQEGSYDLFLIRADGTGQRRLTWDPGNETDPAWSR